MPRYILLSIKPQYAKLIYGGSKRYEFRRRLPKQMDLPILIYESSPVQRITGIVPRAYGLTADRDVLWEKTHAYAGISRETYDAYFGALPVANAIGTYFAYLFTDPIELGTHGLPKYPPQSFCYVDADL